MIKCKSSDSLSDRIVRALNRPAATQTVILDISKAFERVWHAGLLHILTSCGISDLIFGLISSFLSDRWFQVVSNGKPLQEYSVNTSAP